MAWTLFEEQKSKTPKAWQSGEVTHDLRVPQDAALASCTIAMPLFTLPDMRLA
jgi:hypothetical protein